MTDPALAIDRMPSPIGDIVIVTDDTSLLAVEFDDGDGRIEAHLTRHFPNRPLVPTRDPLGMTSRMAAYLGGDMAAFNGVKVAPTGTEFQRGVWLALRDIPAGSTESYRDLANRVGRSKGFRAIGMANSRNPIAVVLPCHRVIGADGTLTGYAGGLDRKAWLLKHEGASFRG